MTQKESYLAVAHEIGCQLSQKASWEGDQVFWHTQPLANPNRRIADEKITIPTSSIFYNGSAGIALFLGYLFQNTGDRGMYRLACGAIRHALDSALELPANSFGFHEGRVGIAYAAVLLAELLEDPVLMSRGVGLLEPLSGREREDAGIDIIAGAAGAIPALLKLHHMVDRDQLVDLAINLGNHLIEKANKEPVGWSWQTLSSPYKRNLCGYGHGASGGGHAMLELYAYTGNDAYRYIAEQSFLYERQFYNSHVSNWLDLRNLKLANYWMHGRVEALKAELKSGKKAPGYQNNFMAAWCHGAPGIGLVRLRAYELLGDSIYAEEAEAALRATKVTFDSRHYNFSLCHGHAGNCELLLNAAEVFDDQAMLLRVQKIAKDAIQLRRQEGKWRHGSPDLLWDPSLMLGDAGIGYFFLRLFNADIPSVLFLKNEGISTVQKDRWPLSIDIRVNYIHQYFGDTVKAFEGMGLDVSRLYKEDDQSANQKPGAITRAYKKIQSLIQESDLDLQPVLSDAFSVERTRYKLTLELDNYAAEKVDNLLKEIYDELQEDEITYQWGPYTRLLKTDWNWSGNTKNIPPEKAEKYHILYRLNNEIQCQPVNSFAAFLLNELRKPTQLDELISRLKDAFPIQTRPASDLLREMVAKQLRHFYEVGVVIKQPQIPKPPSSIMRTPDTDSIEIPMER